MSDKNEVCKNIVIEIVNAKPGIKATELIPEYYEKLFSNQAPELRGSDNILNEDILTLLEEMVIMGDLVEVEYTLPTMNYRIKSLYFPKDTIVKLAGNKDRYEYRCDQFGYYVLTDTITNQTRHLQGDDATDFRNKLYPTDGPTPQEQKVIAEYFN